MVNKNTLGVFQPILDYGVLGLVVLALAFIVWILFKKILTERDELQKRVEKLEKEKDELHDKLIDCEKQKS